MIDQIGDMGLVIGIVVRVLRENRTLGDVTFRDYHHDGVAAAREIEAAGYQVHIFASDLDDARRRRKYRFSPQQMPSRGRRSTASKAGKLPALIMGRSVSRPARSAWPMRP
jgi:hypothetical protein